MAGIYNSDLGNYTGIKIDVFRCMSPDVDAYADVDDNRTDGT